MLLFLCIMVFHLSAGNHFDVQYNSVTDPKFADCPNFASEKKLLLLFEYE